MPAVTPPILLEKSKKRGQQSASQTLKAIARAYPGKLSGTLSLVALENALLLAYPLFAGFAVDSIIRGDAASAVWYAAVVLGFWVVGAARRALDTRTFTRIYADLAVPVILNQRLQRHSTSRAAARVVLAPEIKAGHIYAVMTYLWTFVSCLDESPSMIDQLARLKDIGKRVDPGLDR